MKRKIISLLLAVCMLVGLLPVWQVDASAANYNASAALAYASAHWDDGVGLCAEFVSNCIKAGGSSCYSSSGSTLYNQLVSSGTGTAYDLALVKTSGGVSVKASNYSDRLSPGDVVWFYCSGCSDGKPYVHTVLCNGMDDNGYMKAYSHNNKNNGSNRYYYGTTCPYCGGTISKAVVFHFNGNSGGSGGSTSSLSLSNATVPKAVKQGDSFSIYGTISSNYKINYAAVVIMDLNRNTILSKQIAPGTYSYNVHSIDNDIPFGQLSPGTYYYQIEAKDASQNFQVLYYDQFVVYNDIGTDFYGLIINTNKWKPICNVNGNVEIGSGYRESNQMWKFIRNSDGSYLILSALDGKALDADNYGTSDGTNVLCYNKIGDSNQRWWIISTSKGYLIRPAHTDKVLDMYGANDADGTNIQLWTQHDSIAQYWSIYTGDESQLKATTLSVSAGTPTTPTKFSWNEVVAETAYDVKIWNGTIWEGDAYHVQWGVDGLSWSTTLPAGYYEAYVDAYNYFERKMSNTVSFSIRPKITVTAGTDTEKTTYSWGAMSGAKQYTITIHSGSSGKDQTFQTTETSGSIALVAGNYTIKVAGYDGTHTLTSDTVSFTVKNHTHSYNSGVITTAPTCTKTGVKTYTCTICKSTKTETIAATGHSYELKNAVAATCTTSGYTGDQICKNCGNVKSNGNTIPATGHSWGNWVVTKNATETEQGVETRTCSVCKAQENRSIPTLAHTHNYQFSQTIAPTCTTAGYDLYRCSCGAEEKRNQKSATGHSYELRNAVAATCTTSGYTGDQICKNCGNVKSKGNTIPATGHSWGNWVVTKNATETEQGVETRTCSVCKAQESRSIPTLAHTHNYQFSQTVAPTCTTAGYDLYRCSCGAEEKRNQKSATGHSYELRNAVAATCTVSGYTGDEICKNCGNVKSKGNTIPATGHSWAEWTVITPATYLHSGTQTRTCTICGASETQEISVLSSPFVDVQDPNSYCYDAVLWAVENGITNGYDETHFLPNRSCTRAQIVTFLWRAAGSPEPSSNNNPFTDVTDGPYYKAILWAVEKGITKGTTATTFAPNAACTRAQIVTFIYRAAGEPQIQNSTNPFTDVKGGAYYKAILWAVDSGITKGTTATTFAPSATCTRGQGVTFLYRGRDLLQ